MLQKLFTILRVQITNGCGRALMKSVSVLALALIVPIAAFSYTLVLRGGRRIEIPSTFTLTEKVLTYQAAPGINVSVQVSSIDIVATEHANNEQPGSLLKRAFERQASPEELNSAQETNDRSSRSDTSATLRARKTLTNRDLESVRRARIESEAAYEKRRIELRLPTREEMQRRNEIETQRLREQSQESEESEAQQEAYWRARASSLRVESAALDAEINSLRASVDALPNQTLYGFVSGYAQTFPFVYGAIQTPVITNGIGGFGAGRAAGAQVVARIGFGGGQTRGQVFLNAGSVNSVYNRRVIVAPGIVQGLPLAVFAAPFQTGGDYSYERSALLTRLRELEAARAGIEARWRLLEEEARRAGALPGWLRP